MRFGGGARGRGVDLRRCFGLIGASACERNRSRHLRRRHHQTLLDHALPCFALAPGAAASGVVTAFVTEEWVFQQHNTKQTLFVIANHSKGTMRYWHTTRTLAHQRHQRFSLSYTKNQLLNQPQSLKVSQFERSSGPCRGPGSNAGGIYRHSPQYAPIVCAANATTPVTIAGTQGPCPHLAAWRPATRTTAPCRTRVNPCRFGVCNSAGRGFLAWRGFYCQLLNLANV